MRGEILIKFISSSLSMASEQRAVEVKNVSWHAAVAKVGRKF